MAEGRGFREGIRKKVAEAGLERVALDALLERLKEEGLLRAGGKQRTDSTGVIAAVAALNRLELAGESMRAALDALAAAAPGWTMSVLGESWMRRYGTPVTSWRPPMTEKKRSELAVAYAEDGYALLGAVDDPASPDWLRNIPAVQVLRTVLLQDYVIVTGEDGTEVFRRREKSVREGGDGLPPGDKRIASRWDLDARWSLKRDEFWLGYKLRITETCHDRPPCDCGGKCRKGCAAAAFPNLITDVATTPATVTGNAMTSVIDDHLAARELVPARRYPDSGYLSAQILVDELRRLGSASPPPPSSAPARPTPTSTVSAARRIKIVAPRATSRSQTSKQPWPTTGTRSSPYRLYTEAPEGINLMLVQAVCEKVWILDTGVG